MLRKLLPILSIAFLCSPSAFANQPVLKAIPNASIVASATLSYAFWDIYQATLYAPKGQWSPNQPFALSIKYYQPINGKKIATQSIKEMRKQGFIDERKLAAWHTQMSAIFPNVKNGTILSAVYQPNQYTMFYHANQPIGAIKDPEFSKLFFDIWFSEKTSEPELRRILLGLS